MKFFTVDPSGESKIVDLDNPNVDALKQIADVLIRRLNNLKTLEFIYLDEDNTVVPADLKKIVQDLVDAKINEEEAEIAILDWKSKL